MPSNEEIDKQYKEAIELVDLRENRTGEYILNLLIEQAFTVFSNKLGFGGIKAENEFSFQFEFGSILKALGQLYEFRVEDQFHLEFESGFLFEEDYSRNKSNKGRIDLFIKYLFNSKLTKVAIEIKFFKKENNREPNNRYDAFKDILKLEAYKRQGVEMCYFILVTDHEHYVVKQKYSDKTKDFDLGQGKSYKANTVLSYRTDNPNYPDMVLEGDYVFNWQKMPKTKEETGNYYGLLLRI